MTGRCGPDQQTTSSLAGPSPFPSTPCGLSPLLLPSMEGLPSSLPMLLLLHLLERLSSFLRYVVLCSTMYSTQGGVVSLCQLAGGNWPILRPPNQCSLPPPVPLVGRPGPLHPPDGDPQSHARPRSPHVVWSRPLPPLLLSGGLRRLLHQGHPCQERLQP